MEMQLPEEVELVWDDTVAPETCIDFDYPQADTTEVMQGWLYMGAFFALLTGYIYWTDPVKSNPVALRETVLPFNGLQYELGLGPLEASDGEEAHDDEDDDDDDDDE